MNPQKNSSKDLSCTALRCQINVPVNGQMNGTMKGNTQVEDPVFQFFGNAQLESADIYMIYFQLK